jgi:hypothetical protein
MKRVLFVMFVLVIVSSFAFGQQDATIIQGGAAAQTNTATSDQSGGSGNLIFIEQIINNGTATADNTANLLQDGNSNIARVKQTAGATGVSTVGPTWVPYNTANITQIGNNNKLVGATNMGQILETANARQYSKLSWNALTVNQIGNRNKVGLNQDSQVFNNAAAGFKQQGDDNLFVVYQKATSGGSTVESAQQLIDAQQEGSNNLALVRQDGRMYQHVNVIQSGSGNKLVGADFSGVINEADAATQLADKATYRGDSELRVRQYGGDNTVGLFQDATSAQNIPGSGMRNNYANISQTLGGNALGAYQLTTNGWNELRFLGYYKPGR